MGAPAESAGVGGAVGLRWPIGLRFELAGHFDERVAGLCRSLSTATNADRTHRSAMRWPDGRSVVAPAGAAFQFPMPTMTMAAEMIIALRRSAVRRGLDRSPARVQVAVGSAWRPRSSRRAWRSEYLQFSASHES